jgi:hypothetical protein
MRKSKKREDGLIEVYCRYYTTKTGKRINHPTGGVFHFFVKPKRK